jgi:hypothetical protein
MRPSRRRNVSLNEAILRGEEWGSIPADPLDDPERAATWNVITAQFRRFVDEELTEKQRPA